MIQVTKWKPVHTYSHHFHREVTPAVLCREHRPPLQEVWRHQHCFPRHFCLNEDHMYRITDRKHGGIVHHSRCFTCDRNKVWRKQSVTETNHHLSWHLGINEDQVYRVTNRKHQRIVQRIVHHSRRFICDRFKVNTQSLVTLASERTVSLHKYIDACRD